MLYDGIKVIWFGTESEVSELNERYTDFIQSRILETFVYSGSEDLCIEDGNIDDVETFDVVTRSVPGFNVGQYLVEHSLERCIEVRASAGTGKTTVMVDRILFLVLTGKAEPSEISMITFTNEATNQMGRRLQEALVNRYRLTGKDKFLSILEKTSLVSISTIDSFSMNLLKKYGMNIGYSQDVTVRSYKQELRDIIIDIIDRNYRKGSSVKSVVGTGLYDAQRLFEDFYERLLSMGISVDDVDRMDWGEGTDPDSGNLQMFLRAVLDGIDGELEWRKRHNDRTSLSELTFDVSRALSLDEGLERRIKYLFVDEFQDTNTLQIDLLTSFIIQTDADLFVVGDSKQSIYRFRGADDSAFDVLDMHMKKAGRDIAVFELVNNYRTDPRVLDATVRVFRTWVSNGLLDDFNKPVGCGVSDGGVFRFKEMGKRDNLGKVLPPVIREALEDVRRRRGEGLTDKNGRVAVIVRTNKQLDKILDICKANQIPPISDRDEPLYASDSTRDFYSMISSFIYDSEPEFLFDFLMSPYAVLSEPLDMSELMDAEGDQTMLLDYLTTVLESTDWFEYRQRFMYEPSLSVIQDIVNTVPVVDNYIAGLKANGVVDEKYLELMALKYRLNLEKLLGILFNRFAGDSASLYSISEFLRLSIATNREESEAEVDPEDALSAVLCLTVHKAKGLEFDTVILPFDWKMSMPERSEMLISADRKTVGWKFYKENDGGSEKRLTNTKYGLVEKEERVRNQKEEARILYVAMTRAARKLIVFRYEVKPHTLSWSSMAGGLGR